MASTDSDTETASSSSGGCSSESPTPSAGSSAPPNKLYLPPPPQPPQPPPRPQNLAAAAPAAYCPTKLMIQNHSNFKRSGPPARVMFYSEEGAWVDFSTEIFVKVKDAFVEGRPVVEVWSCLFDFMRMVETDLGSGFQRSIAWIDEKGKCFFPKVFLGKRAKPEPQKIQLEITIDDVSIRGRGNECGESSKRQRIVEGGEDLKWPNTRVVREGEQAYVLVRDYFLYGMKKVDPNVTITAVRQCTHDGSLEKARYQMFLKQVELTKEARGLDNSVCAWHGAVAQGVTSILTHGFGTPCRFMGQQSFGVGVYLSALGLPHISAQLAEIDDKGERHVLLCKVILGNVEKVEAGSTQCYPSSVDYDTGSDDPQNPKWYIVWASNMNTHIVPNYVVSFRCSNLMAGPSRGLPANKFTMENLFAKIRSVLSPEQAREMKSFFDAHKEGWLSKDGFMKEVRRIVGDEGMKKIIYELRDSK